MIPLDKGKFAIVDEADVPLVLSGKGWSATQHRPGRTWYAKRSGGASMHVLIAGYKGVDHANRNGLDNRRINLRPATPSQNAANCSPSRRNKSGYKGVWWDRSARKWVASIGVNGRVIRLGAFGDPVEAARAYNRAAAEAFGEYAWLNPVLPLVTT
jgi:hypothetical protein